MGKEKIKEKEKGKIVRRLVWVRGLGNIYIKKTKLFSKLALFLCGFYWSFL